MSERPNATWGAIRAGHVPAKTKATSERGHLVVPRCPSEPENQKKNKSPYWGSLASLDATLEAGPPLSLRVFSTNSITPASANE